MNETIRIILERRSIRGYKPDPVPQEYVEAIVECGTFAPTGMGMQPWHFTVVQSRALLDKIAAANSEMMLKEGGPMAERVKQMEAEGKKLDNFFGAPMAVIMSGEDARGGGLADCANAVENMIIAAHSLGLGTCYLGSFKMAMLEPEYKYLLDELQIPAGFTPNYAIAVGYPDFTPDERVPRRADGVTYIK